MPIRPLLEDIASGEATSNQIPSAPTQLRILGFRTASLCGNDLLWKCFKLYDPPLQRQRESDIFPLAVHVGSSNVHGKTRVIHAVILATSYIPRGCFSSPISLYKTQSEATWV